LKSTNQTHETQQDLEKINGAIDRFFQNFHLATIFNQSGIRKTKGTSALTIMSSIFALAFIGKDFFRVFLLSLDFELLSSRDKKNRFQVITKDVDKRSCGYKASSILG
jgi:hypothetical protein